MSEPPASASFVPREPQDGDVVVVRAGAGSRPAFGVRQVPTGIQLGARTKQEALALARGFAVSKAVNLWYSENDEYQLVEQLRPAAEPT